MGLGKVLFLLAAGLYILVNFGPGIAAQPLRRAAVDEQAPMQKQAQQAAQGPLKLDVRPLERDTRLGGKASVEIVLLNAANRPAAWNQKSELRVELTVTGPSKRSKVYSSSIKQGQSAVQFSFEVTEIGLLSLKVRDVNDRLLSGGNSILVQKSVAFRPARTHAWGYQLAAVRSFEASSLMTATEGARQQPDSTALLLEDATGREILADGIDSARIKVHFMGGEAPGDIKVWLKWSNGQLKPQPLVIKKGDSGAEAEWISRSPVEARLSLVTSTPRYAVEGPSELNVSFVPPIYGIAFLNPNPLSLWLIDYVPVQVAFFDHDGKTINTSKLRKLTFTNSNPGILHVNLLESDVARDQSGASISVWPAWSGRSVLAVSTPGYEPRTLDVVVAVWLVLTLCLSGGVLGGIAATKSVNASLMWRVFVGVLGAIALVWFFVYAVVPNSSSIIAHNLVSVLVVGILGGYGGTRVLDFLGKKWGFL